MKLICTLLLTVIFTACAGEPTINKFLHQEMVQDHTYRIRDYKTARKYLFGKLHLKNGTVTDVYCQQVFDEGDGVGYMLIPDSDKLNCEHTHPRSKFNDDMTYSHQLADLHHLFPTESKSNFSRSNYEFGDVDEPIKIVCGKSKVGYKSGRKIFEPPVAHKGNVARAKFYFSIRYKVPIGRLEEATLRAWHKLDPVDQAEIDRNYDIRDIQGNLNPFIEYPHLVDKVRDF